jgi:hypothetical protein
MDVSHCTTTAAIIGSYVNYIHIAICCDIMTNRGQVPNGYFLISIINDHVFYKLISKKIVKCKINN